MGAYMPPPPTTYTHRNPHKHTSPYTLPGSQKWGIPDRQGTRKMGGREHWGGGDVVNGCPQRCKHSQGHRARRYRALGCWGTLETGRLSDSKLKSRQIPPTQLQPTQPTFNLVQFISVQFSPTPTQWKSKMYFILTQPGQNSAHP